MTGRTAGQDDSTEGTGTAGTTRWVIVGVDGSDSSRYALEWSAHDAVLRGHGLRIITAVPPAEQEGPFGEFLRDRESTSAHRTAEARALLGYARDWIGRLFPELEIDARFVDERPADAMLAAAREPDAASVVVGSRGLGSLASAFVGSVGVELAAHAPVPVVVLPKRHEAATGVTGHVVVGVDGSEAGARAVEFAFTEAARRGTSLVAVTAWQPMATFASSLGPVPAEVFDDDVVIESAQKALDESLAAARAAHPDVPVETRVPRGHPVVALLEAAGPADLVVVGSRGRGGFRGLLLGSVSQSVLHGATGPVAVVR